jgi:hypothetical protein
MKKAILIFFTVTILVANYIAEARPGLTIGAYSGLATEVVPDNVVN